jgi:methyl-accepting chemotaxis protein
MSNLQSILKLPGAQSHADEFVADLQGTDADRGRMLRRFVTTFFGLGMVGNLVLALLGGIGILPREMLLFAAASAASVCTITGLSYLCLQKFSYTTAISLFLYSTVLYVTLMLAAIGGVTGPLFVGYLLPIIAAGVFGRARDAVWLLIVGVCAYAATALAMFSTGITPLVVLTPRDQFVFTSIVLASTGIILAILALFWSRMNAEFVRQTQKHAEEAYNYTDTLMRKGIQQVEVGNELSAAAAELLAASHQQARGATEQASAVSEISTTIEELGATARQIAVSAEQVAEAARQTLENLSEGQGAVDNSIQAMERIRGKVRDVSERVLSLGERSQQIGEIIDLINDLSDETHLLALNAAIEAAGAGEHGRRFAVVAAEVKSLANRALAAAKEVKGVIAEVQKATNASVLAAEEGGKEVEKGVELANRAGLVMDAIVMAAERTAQSASEISLATAQQQSASEQVVETMREVAEVARQTAAGSRQMADSAQMLTAIAERLHGLTTERT